eukprot:CAMPEP_0206137962 /NCGR_PEP_ID=MMETSP1473-20131121/2973_1 /ASSEMBLY_ACC=CAM_ASM_001109 /TAXON_ID=1461547 /ORGANISM="Stichococcus sp, Strain RCC1054" /LENGTH=38 /DNA_ID= /DNA_START= /DNA_END= /DNA_ORIENTATION=
MTDKAGHYGQQQTSQTAQIADLVCERLPNRRTATQDAS